MRLLKIYLRKYKEYKYVWEEPFVYLRHFNLQISKTAQYTLFTVYRYIELHIKVI